MKISEYRNYVSTSFPENIPYGESVTEHADFDFIETQLMKVGSLAHEEIEWAKVESASLQLLGKVGKDFKVLSALVQTLQYQSTPERFNLSLSILSDFISFYWESPFPFKGVRGEVAKKKLMNQIIDRSLKAFDQIESPYDISDKNELSENISFVEQACTKYKIEDVEWKKLKGLLTRVADVKDNHDEKESRDQSKNSSNPSQITEYASVPQTKVVFDSSDERSLKRTLNQMIQFLHEMKEVFLVVKIRRLALWHTINTPPQGNDNGETELAAVPIDKVVEYKESLSKADDVLWEQIEHSISLSPFWLDGHYLSFQVAEKLGYLSVACLIKTELQAFIEKVPAVTSMKFKGGVPFLSAEVRTWLEAIDTNSSDLDRSQEQDSVLLGKHMSEMQSNISFATDLQDKVLVMLDKEGLEETIQYLNEGFMASTTLRESCYWKLALAGVYQNKGLSALAGTLYESVFEIVNGTNVKVWESDLSEKLLHIMNESRIIV